jgi:hypothetical protein
MTNFMFKAYFWSFVFGMGAGAFLMGKCDAEHARPTPSTPLACPPATCPATTCPDPKQAATAPPKRRSSPPAYATAPNGAPLGSVIVPTKPSLDDDMSLPSFRH